MPAVLYLERADTRERINFDAMPEEIDTSVLSLDSNISLWALISHCQDGKLKGRLATGKTVGSNTTLFIRTSFRVRGC